MLHRFGCTCAMFKEWGHGDIFIIYCFALPDMKVFTRFIKHVMLYVIYSFIVQGKLKLLISLLGISNY